ncbi:hypothetical protein H6G76_10465 [Nostoc sp. FACHB-152]|uniref:hypothetical protein n=1 Tax=unclassified Nostoc TaxID=2593658 RepID=UPI001684BFBD|nr:MULTISPECIES: hypothetical protein [unclassified Nostoc]MBD2447586.1 hypothetical protein [Nostoc sp. FACHB-152]MBD2469358.1 hypothetical protein [Nostoc sp. FACHB-145]
MKDCRPRLNQQIGWVLAVLAAVTTTPVIAETPNFGKFSLLPGFEASQGKFSGYTGGSYSVSAISNRDRDKNACIGFADPKPDHIMVLEKDFEHLRILVNTGDADTTLLIQGPDDNIIRCGDDTGKSKDASIDDRNWKKGTYQIWVGTFNAGVKRKYTLTVQQL